MSVCVSRAFAARGQAPLPAPTPCAGLPTSRHRPPARHAPLEQAVVHQGRPVGADAGFGAAQQQGGTTAIQVQQPAQTGVPNMESKTAAAARTATPPDSPPYPSVFRPRSKRSAARCPHSPRASAAADTSCSRVGAGAARAFSPGAPVWLAGRLAGWLAGWLLQAHYPVGSTAPEPKYSNCRAATETSRKAGRT